MLIGLLLGKYLNDVVNPLIDNLITLLCAILLTSGEDGRSQAEQLLHILRQIDQYVSSHVECQRKEVVLQCMRCFSSFQTLCASGYCALGCLGSCMHSKQINRCRHMYCQVVKPCVIMYLPRCADTNSQVRKHSAQLQLLQEVSVKFEACNYFDSHLCWMGLDPYN